MILLGYIKSRPTSPYKCGVCHHEIQGGYAMFTRLSDHVGMCFKCYVNECRKSRNDHSKCYCRTCPYKGQPMCEHILMSKENLALKERVKQLERQMLALSKKVMKFKKGNEKNASKT